MGTSSSVGESERAWHGELAHWQKDLVARLERGVGRTLTDGDLRCVEWNWSAGTLTVASEPLLREVRGCNLISNVFRSRSHKWEVHE